MKNIFPFFQESENAHTSNQNQHFQEICRDRIRVTELNPIILSFTQQNTMGIGNESLGPIAIRRTSLNVPSILTPAKDRENAETNIIETPLDIQEVKTPEMLEFGLTESVINSSSGTVFDEVKSSKNALATHQRIFVILMMKIISKF